MSRLNQKDRDMVQDLKRLYELDIKAISKDGVNIDEQIERKNLNQKYNWMASIPTLIAIIEYLDKNE